MNTEQIKKDMKERRAKMFIARHDLEMEMKTTTDIISHSAKAQGISVLTTKIEYLELLLYKYFNVTYK